MEHMTFYIMIQAIKKERSYIVKIKLEMKKKKKIRICELSLFIRTLHKQLL